MLYGAQYFYIDYMVFNNPIQEKIWLDDGCDRENTILINIYATKKDAEKDRFLLSDRRNFL